MQEMIPEIIYSLIEVVLNEALKEYPEISNDTNRLNKLKLIVKNFYSLIKERSLLRIAQKA